MAEYGIVAWTKEEWHFKAENTSASDRNLIKLLDSAGKRGWRVVAAGNFGGSELAELILEHE